MPQCNPNNFRRTRGSGRRILMKRNPLILTTAFSRTALAALAISLPGMIMSAGTGIAGRPKPAKPAQTAPSPAGAKSSPEADDLSAVLAKMNQSAAGFKSAQGDFQFESYQKLWTRKTSSRAKSIFVAAIRAWMRLSSRRAGAQAGGL